MKLSTDDREMYAEVCNIYCDKRDPAQAAGDRIAGTSSVWSRQVVLHISDGDNMGWAGIENGDPGDEVWLDRSFDGGRTWEPDGSKLGDTTIPSGQRGWRTLMYNVDNPSARGIGALRACGKAGNRPEITCTPWARSTVNAATREAAAATALMQFYDNSRGLWNTTGWWNSANALTALIDYSQRTGSTTYRYAIGNTFDKNRGNNFTNEYLDDTGWWGLAWVRAYDLTGEQRYLDMARIDADYMHSYWDGHCGGGVWWRTDKTYKNAVTNELYIKLSAALHNRIPGDTAYLGRAQAGWSWFQASGMINSSNLVNDGLDNTTCQNNGQTMWTYNQGIVLGGLVELSRATGDAGMLTRARQLADASTNNGTLNPGGVLREPCENGDCGGDGPSFKGVYVRNLGELDRALSGRPYRSYLARQADSAYANDRNSLSQYGLHWAGPFDSSDAARQHSALEALVAPL
ncbi:glycoside hydrolase family 76 protein [Flindersiella endophytica]